MQDHYFNAGHQMTFGWLDQDLLRELSSHWGTLLFPRLPTEKNPPESTFLFPNSSLKSLLGDALFVSDFG